MFKVVNHDHGVKPFAGRRLQSITDTPPAAGLVVAQSPKWRCALTMAPGGICKNQPFCASAAITT